MIKKFLILTFALLQMLYIKGVLAQDNTPLDQSKGQIISWLISTFAILAIIFVIAYFLKKTPFVKKNTGKLTIENQLFIGSKQKVLLVKAGSKKILLGVTAQNINYLCDYTDDKDLFEKILNEKSSLDDLNDISSKIENNKNDNDDINVKENIKGNNDK